LDQLVLIISKPSFILTILLLLLSRQIRLVHQLHQQAYLVRNQQQQQLVVLEDLVQQAVHSAQQQHRQQ
jgi:hypothetical protein